MPVTSKKLIGDDLYFVVAPQVVEQINQDLLLPDHANCVVVKPLGGEKVGVKKPVWRVWVIRT